MRLVFKKDNNVQYGQDFSFLKGINSDVVFTEHKPLFVTEHLIWFKAEGYGKEGNYKNGPICILKEELKSKKDQYIIL